MPCFWHVLCRVCGMFYGLNWKDNVASGQGLFRDGFWSKIACTGAAKELSSTPVCGSHAIAWLGSNLQPSGIQLHGFPRNCVALAHSSSTQLRGFPRNCVAPAHLQTSNFERP